MVTRLIDGFRYADQWGAINADSGGIASISTPTIDGNGSLSFQRSATTQDSAGVKRAYAPPLEMLAYPSAKVYVYIPAADLAQLTSFDVVANSGVLEPYTAYEAQYECDVLPASFPVYPFTAIIGGTNSENINNGILEITTGSGIFDERYYTRDMAVDWLDSLNVYEWVQFRQRLKVPPGAINQWAYTQIQFKSARVTLYFYDGNIDYGAGVFPVDTTSGFFTIELLIQQDPGDFIILVNDEFVYRGNSVSGGAGQWIRFGCPSLQKFAGMMEWDFIRWRRITTGPSYAVYKTPKVDLVDINGDPFVGDEWAMVGFNPGIPTFQLGTPDLADVAEYGFRMNFLEHTAAPTFYLDSLEGEAPVLFYEEPVVVDTWEIDDEIIEAFTGIVIDQLNDPSAWTPSGGAGTIAADGTYTLVGGTALKVPKLAGYDAALISRTIESQNFGTYDNVQAEFYIEASEVPDLRGIFLYLCNDASNYAAYYFGNNIFDTFESISPWTPDGNAVVALDTTHVIEGSKSIKLTNVSAGPAVWTGAARTYDVFALYAPIFYSFFLETVDVALVTDFRVTYTDAGGTTTWEFSGPFSAGWNTVEINTTNFTSQTGTPDFISISQIDIEIKSSTTGVSIFLDNSRFSIPWNDIVEGWNRGFFRVQKPAYTVGTVDYTALDLVYLKYVTFQEGAINTFRWDSLARINDLQLSNAAKVYIDFSDYVNSPSCIKFDKMFGETYGGIIKDYTIRRDYNIFDKLRAFFKLSAVDVDRVDKFQVILDETSKYDKFLNFSTWATRYDGSVLPININLTLQEDFETVSQWSPGGNVTLSANTTQFTEGTQSLQVDYSASFGAAAASKNYSTPFDADGQEKIDFYIPAAELAKVTAVKIQYWEGASYSEYDYPAALVANWQTFIFDPEAPDYESGPGLTRKGIDKVILIYEVNAAVTGFSWDNMRVAEWRLVGTDHWTISASDQQQVDMNNADLSYFEQLAAWGDNETLWFALCPTTTAITSQTPFFEFVTKGRKYTFTISNTQLGIPGPSTTLVNQDFTSAVDILVKVSGIDGSIEVWINEVNVHTGMRPSVLDEDGSRIAYGKLATTQFTGGNIKLDYSREYFDASDTYKPWINTYVADYDPSDVRADPSWSVTHPGLFTTSGGVLTIDGNQSGVYYMEMDTSVHGKWDANSIGVIEMEAQLAANAGLTKWGMEFRVGNKHVLLFMGWDGTQDKIQMRSSLGGATTDVVTDVSNAYYVWRFICDYLHDKFTVIKDDVELITIPFYIDSNSGEILRIGSPVGGSATPGKDWSIKNVYWTKATPIYSVFDSTIVIGEGWNQFVFDLSLPDQEINNPTLEDVGRVEWRVHTPSTLEVLVDPAIDMFGTNETEYIAKLDTYLNDGTREWPARIIAYGEISKSLNGRVGSYSLADFDVQIENVTGWGSRIYTDHGIGLINTPYTVQYGLKDEYWEDYDTLYRGVVSEIKFNGFIMNVSFVDPVPKYFNRLPNQYVTVDSFPNVGDSFKNAVASIVAGTVETDTGAMKAIPVDWQVEITNGAGGKPQNDKIDFKFKPYGGTLGIYVITLTSYDYTNPVTLATEIQTKMNAAIGSPPADPGFSVYFNAIERKMVIQVIKGSELELQWSTGANANYNAADALGFNKDQDKSGSTNIKSDRTYWNKFVVARHWCKEDSNAKLWIGDTYIGDKDNQHVDFTFDHVTADGLKWTIVHTPYKTVGENDIKINISGVTDDETPSGNLVTDPVDFLEIIMTRFVGFPADLIDATRFANARSFTTRNSYSVAGVLNQDIEWTAFIEEYACNFRMDVWMMNAGKLACGFFEPSVNDPTARHLTDILDILVNSYSYGTEFTNIINRIRYEYKKDYVTDKYLEADDEEDASSIKRTKQVYEWPEGILQLNWVRDIITAQRVAASTINLFSEANPLVELQIPFSGQFDPIDLTDKINVTSAQGPFYDKATNIRGYSNRLHRVIELSVDLNEYRMGLKLQDMARLSYNCFFLGDDTWDVAELDWLTASEDNRSIYGYLCDETSGQFSNGDPGKRLC